MIKGLLHKARPLLMGILNVTPDSFFDGGQYLNIEDALRHAMRMVEDGADIIDVGGESTRPFSDPVDAHEELKRVIPVIEAIRSRSDVIISIDTYKSEVAEKACDAGAEIVNDISGLGFDSNMADTIARMGAYVVIMHIKGTPRDMQTNPYYDDVVSEIKGYFQERIALAESKGIKRDKIILDPGIGFGKRVEDNLRIIKGLGSFKDLGMPILIGTSMKSFIGKVTETELDERTEGTLASIAISVWNGADIVRVHDIKKANKVLKLVDAVMKS
ncbi:MAG TPA: dihydropteroate synthase [Syntrophorhabdaceae bacterium]|nr:dihydropteroate synthase [Syntrophorhabdaceae bacterium]HOL05926.1 dihydropteroate synthase [Syntrophorhabdaceae bacterium]HPP41549.1 dihydropteroate synthase [Syntrophorhabdaceae bacterium]